MCLLIFEFFGSRLDCRNLQPVTNEHSMYLPRVSNDAVLASRRVQGVYQPFQKYSSASVAVIVPSHCFGSLAASCVRLCAACTVQMGSDCHSLPCFTSSIQDCSISLPSAPSTDSVVGTAKMVTRKHVVVANGTWTKEDDERRQSIQINKVLLLIMDHITVCFMCRYIPSNYMITAELMTHVRRGTVGHRIVAWTYILVEASCIRRSSGLYLSLHGQYLLGRTS
ncbi:hypothetical protein BR93DRAFT_261875 [Coniochaeta sp. PMI_546]|nr:hypothetical protein BR93DRAFT_261875 [Coniochaeta sp. PMI_546]